MQEILDPAQGDGQRPGLPTPNLSSKSQVSQYIGKRWVDLFSSSQNYPIEVKGGLSWSPKILIVDQSTFGSQRRIFANNFSHLRRNIDMILTQTPSFPQLLFIDLSQDGLSSLESPPVAL